MRLNWNYDIWQKEIFAYSKIITTQKNQQKIYCFHILTIEDNRHELFIECRLFDDKVENSLIINSRFINAFDTKRKAQLASCKYLENHTGLKKYFNNEHESNRESTK